MAIGTYTITNKKIVVDKTTQFETIALKLTAGTGTYVGSEISVPFGGASQAIDLVINEPVTLTNKNGLGGLIIDVSAGSVEVIANTL